MAVRDFEKNLTPEYCSKYIQNLKKVMKIIVVIIIVDRNGGWSNC